jgi:hypothetical protein
MDGGADVQGPVPPVSHHVNPSSHGEIVHDLF